MAYHVFHGPYPSWTQLQPATGNPTTDTNIWQSALDSVGRTSSPLLYGHGMYHLEAKLHCGIGTAGATRGVLGASILGHSNTDTGFVWDGPPPTAAEGMNGQACMFEHNGLSSLEFGRLTFDMNGVATVGVADNWDNSADFFPTFNHYFDCIFKNNNPMSPVTGPQSETAAFALGLSGYGASEGYFERCIFEMQTGHDYQYQNTVVAAMVYNFNALNNLFKNCAFRGMQYGLTCYTPASNYGGDCAAMFCSFDNIERGHLCMVNVCPNWGDRFSYHRGAWRSFEGGAIGPATPHVTIQGCTLATSSTAQIDFGNAGPIGMVDNIVAGNWESYPYSVQARAGYTPDGNGEMWGIGNKYAVATPYFESPVNRVWSVSDLVNQPFTDPGPPADPVEPANATVPVYEAQSMGLKAATDAAIAGGVPAVVHIAYGDTDAGNQRIVIPPRTPVSFEGDGEPVASVTWQGNDTDPVFELQQPSLVEMEGFRVNCKGNVYPPTDAILISGDCEGGVVRLERVKNSSVVQQGGLRAVNTGNVVVEAIKCNFGGTTNGEYAISSEGNARINMIFGNCGSGVEPFFRVLDGGKLCAMNVYAEDVPSQAAIPIAHNCNGTMHIDGGQLGVNLVDADWTSFQGSLTISNYGMSLTSPGTVKPPNNSLLLGVSCNDVTFDTTGLSQYAILEPRLGSYGDTQAPEQSAGISDMQQYISDHMTLLRSAKPVELVPVDQVPEGYCQIIIRNVSTNNERSCVSIIGTGVIPPPPSPPQGLEMKYQGTYNSSTTYMAGDVVRIGGIYGISLIDNNTGNAVVDGAIWNTFAQQGPAGQNGAPGNPGAPGESAYQIAVDNGFSGTQQQWLASLVGPKGDKGDPGTGSGSARVDTFSMADNFTPGETTIFDGASYVNTRATQGSSPVVLKDFALLARGEHVLFAADCTDLGKFASNEVSDPVHAQVGTGSGVMFSNTDGSAGAYAMANTPSFSVPSHKLRLQTRVNYNAWSLGTGAVGPLSVVSADGRAVSFYSAGGTWGIGASPAGGGWDFVPGTTQTYNLNQWYTLELLVDASGPQSVYKLFVNGVLDATLTDTTTGSQWLPAYALVGISVNPDWPANGACNANFDQVVLLDA